LVLIAQAIFIFRARQTDRQTDRQTRLNAIHMPQQRQLQHGDSEGDNNEENSSIFFLVYMHYMPSQRAYGR